MALTCYLCKNNIKHYWKSGGISRNWNTYIIRICFKCCSKENKLLVQKYIKRIQEDRWLIE